MGRVYTLEKKNWGKNDTMSDIDDLIMHLNTIQKCWKFSPLTFAKIWIWQLQFMNKHEWLRILFMDFKCCGHIAFGLHDKIGNQPFNLDFFKKNIFTLNNQGWLMLYVKAVQPIQECGNIEVNEIR